MSGYAAGPETERSILQTLETLLKDYGTLIYILLFAYCALKSGALPLFAGYAAQTGALDLAPIVLATFSGGYLGDEARFAAARRYGSTLYRGRPRIRRAIATAGAVMEHYGAAYIFLYRYPKGMRTIGALPVGLGTMPWGRFTGLNALSALLWTTILVGTGYIFGNVIERTVAQNWGLASVSLLIVFAVVSLLAWRKVSGLAVAETEPGHNSAK